MLKVFKVAETDVSQAGFTASFFNFFQGRATAFAILFTVCGLVLAFTGKLTVEYSAFVTSIQGLVFAHSCKEDWHEQRMTTLAQQGAAANNVTVDSNPAPDVPAAGSGSPPAGGNS